MGEETKEKCRLTVFPLESTSDLPFSLAESAAPLAHRPLHNAIRVFFFRFLNFGDRMFKRPSIFLLTYIINIYCYVSTKDWGAGTQEGGGGAVLFSFNSNKNGNISEKDNAMRGIKGEGVVILSSFLSPSLFLTLTKKSKIIQL